MAVAYLILAHNNPEQLARLVATLPVESPILIHFDRGADRELYQRTVRLLGNRDKLQFVERHACRWGDIGIVRGTVSLIRALAEGGYAFDHAILLSGADYPIKSNREIATFLAANRDREFIESFAFDEPNPWTNAGGYYKVPAKVLARHLRFRSRIIRLPGLREAPLGLRLYGGAQWWCLSSEAVRYLNDFIARNPELLRFYSGSFIPDESFIQTILANSPLAHRITGHHRRLIIWDRPVPPYPAILKMDDLEMLLASDNLFARKFDPKMDAGILDALDKRNAAFDS